MCVCEYIPSILSTPSTIATYRISFDILKQVKKHRKTVIGVQVPFFPPFFWVVDPRFGCTTSVANPIPSPPGFVPTPDSERLGP